MQNEVEYLEQYRDMQARIKALATYPVGCGFTVSRLNQDDQLQDLHRRLRPLPTYMYLTEREQELETIARGHLRFYPAGLRAQLAAFSSDEDSDEPQDPELEKIRSMIKKVMDARTGKRSDIDEVILRVAELQDLQAQVKRVEALLDAVETYNADYARALRLLYVDGLTAVRAAAVMNTTRQNFYRAFRTPALAKYIELSS